MSAFPSAAPWPAFRAFAQCFIPETERATEPQWSALESAVSAALAARPARLRRQLILFVRLLDLTARARFRAGFARLGAERGTALLSGFAASRVLLFRRGVWGLRTLVMMGWYTDPAVIASLGYHASAAGWEARR